MHIQAVEPRERALTVRWSDACATDRPEEWLLIEWPEDEEQPTKYWLSTPLEDIGFVDLVDATRGRWRIERDYQDPKQDVGLGHHEGRGWRGFHDHATLCIAAYGFLICERGAFFPPQNGAQPANSSSLQFSPVDDPTLPPLRPQRHVTNSTTIRRSLTAALARTISRCPCCLAPRRRKIPAQVFMTQ